MTDIDVPDWVVAVALKAWFHGEEYEGADMSAFTEDMRTTLRAALAAWVVRDGYIAGPELRGLDAARRLGTKSYGTVWSEPTGQAGTPLYTLRQEKPE